MIKAGIDRLNSQTEKEAVMKKTLIIGSILFTVIALVFPGPALAQGTRTFEVTITNLTGGQIFSPPIVLAHDNDFNLFTLGEPASEALTGLAEDGDTSGLVDMAENMPSIYGYAMADGPVLPGTSAVVEIDTHHTAKRLSVAGMLVTTNDAFFAVRGARTWGIFLEPLHASAYDAGSEVNSENCSDIPGPPCGNGGVRNTADAEGYVHIHAGIHGTMDISTAEFDWNNPVALIRIQRK